MRRLNLLAMVLSVFAGVASAQNIYYVRSDGSDANSGNTNTSAGAKATLSAAITAASSGDIIQIGPGSFSGAGFSSLSLGSKYLKIIGAGSGSNAATSTIITGSGSGTFMTPAKGASTSARMEVWNLNLSAFVTYFNNVDSNSYFYNIAIKGDTTYYQVGWVFNDNAGNIDVEKCTATYLWNKSSPDGHVFLSQDDYNLYNLNVRQCSFTSNYINFYFSQSAAAASKKSADNITISNCSFNDIGYKAIYAERLDNLTVENCSFNSVGQSSSGHPAAIDVNLKWETFSGDINIRHCYFNACAIPASGTDANGAAILFKARDFGSYGSDVATFSGNLIIDGCIFKNNNAGIRIGESHNGASGVGGSDNSHYGAGTIAIRNCIIQSNTGGSNQAYNHFGVRNVTTRSISVSNCYFGGSSASSNTAFTGPIDVSSPHSGSSSVSSLTTGDVIRLNSSNTFQADYASLAAAITAASDGDKIIFPPATINGTTTVDKNLTLTSPGAGRLFSSHLSTFQNLTVSSNKTLTTGSDFKVSSALTVNSGNGLTLGKYMSLDLAGTLSSGGTFTGGVTSSVPNSELVLSGSGSISIPAFANGLAVLNIERGVSDVISLIANMNASNIYFTNGSIDLNGFKLTLNGSPITNSINISGAATGSELEISGTGRSFPINAGTLDKLTINRAQGAELAGDLTINSTLALSNGSLRLGSFNCTLESAASISGTPSASKMVIATGSGQLRKVYSSTGSFTFPVGDDAGTFEYSPVTLNFTAGTFGSGAFAGVKLADAKHAGNSSTTDFITRNWTVTSSNISSFSCQTTFSYLDADINGTEASMVGGKFSSGWISLGAVTAASNQFGGTVTGFSDFTAGELSALPVSWLGVQAKACTEQDVLVSWQTATEISNDHFEVERSYNGKDFEKVAMVKGQGTKLSPSSYEIIDWAALVDGHQQAYYRIRQVDHNGEFSYSAVVVVNKGTQGSLTLYPNPVIDVTQLILPQAEELSAVSITDMQGRVWVLSPGQYTLSGKRLQLQGLETLGRGMYLLQVNTPLNSYHCRLLK